MELYTQPNWIALMLASFEGVQRLLHQEATYLDDNVHARRSLGGSP